MLFVHYTVYHQHTRATGKGCSSDLDMRYLRVACPCDLGIEDVEIREGLMRPYGPFAEEPGSESADACTDK